MTASAVVVAALTIGVAQEKPDFSGTWTLVEPGKRSTTTMVVTQSSESMMLEVSNRGKDTARYVFPLSDVKSEPPAPGQPTTGPVSRATWEGAKLVLSVTSPDGARVLRQLWSMVDGDLVVTLSEINQATGAVLRETKQIFKRG
jgi:hypothetical protein